MTEQELAWLYGEPVDPYDEVAAENCEPLLFNHLQ